MTSSDPIADMLTRIRNAGVARIEKIEMPASQIKFQLAKLLQQDGYVSSVELIEQHPQDRLAIVLRFDKQHKSVIQGIRRLSKPGRRQYISKDEIPRVKNGLGVCYLSTSKGVVSDTEARRLGVGGELLCEVW